MYRKRRENHSTDFQQETFVGIILAVPYLPEGSNAAYGAVGRAVGSMQSDLPIERCGCIVSVYVAGSDGVGGWEAVRAFQYSVSAERISIESKIRVTLQWEGCKIKYQFIEQKI